MQGTLYKAEQIWLRSYFEDIPQADFSLEFETQMRHSNVGLQEVLDILRFGEVIHAEKNVEDCRFIITGRNCDEEEITIWGGFSSEIQMVSLNKLEKMR